MPRTAEWESRWWSPIINAEHLQMRETAGLVDLTAFVIFDVIGPGALDAVQRIVHAPDGRRRRQGRLHAGAVRRAAASSPTSPIMRLAHDHFRVVTGGAHGMADMKWFTDHLPADGTAQLVDLTSAYTTLGIWGPKAREILQSVTRDDVSNEGFPFGTCRTIEIGPLRVLASRISYVGDLGWELYVPMEQGARLWDVLWEAGQPHGLIPVGIGVYGTTGRLEKGYRAFGTELETRVQRRRGRHGSRRRSRTQTSSARRRTWRTATRSRPPILCSLTVDDHTSQHR